MTQSPNGEFVVLLESSWRELSCSSLVLGKMSGEVNLIMGKWGLPCSTRETNLTDEKISSRALQNTYWICKWASKLLRVLASRVQKGVTRQVGSRVAIPRIYIYIYMREVPSFDPNLEALSAQVECWISHQAREDGLGEARGDGLASIRFYYQVFIPMGVTVSTGSPRESLH